MAVTPPAQRIWRKEPIQRVELIWTVLAFLWGLAMFATMIAWHIVGKQNLASEAYRIAPATYMQRTEAFAKKYKVREEAKSGVPVVHPPAGADIYMLGRLWEWWPVLELEKGQSYRLHLSSAHGSHHRRLHHRLGRDHPDTHLPVVGRHRQQHRSVDVQGGVVGHGARVAADQRVGARGALVRHRRPSPSARSRSPRR